MWLAAITLAATAGAAPDRDAVAAVTLDGIPPAELGTDERLAAYLDSRAALSLGFSPQGQVLIRSRFGSTQQLHLVEQPGGVRRQLTFGRKPVGWAAFSPDPAHQAIAFVQGAAGDGRSQLFYQRLTEPGARQLSNSPAGITAPLWSHSGLAIAFGSTAPNGQDHDILVVDADSGAPPRTVVGGDGADWRALDWAADDHLLLVLKTVSRTEAHVYLVDLASGQRREIDPLPNAVSIRDARLAPDGQGVYYLTDAYGEFVQLRYVNIFTGQKSALSEHIVNDVTELALSRDGRYLAFISRDGLSDRLDLVDLIAHQDLRIPALPAACVLQGLAFDADSKQLVFTLDSPSQPGDAWVLDIGAMRVVPWTHSEAGPVASARFVAPRLVKIPTFDRDGLRTRAIPTYVYAPAAAPATSARHPVLIALEGGPDEPFRPGFDPWIQYLVKERGYVVVAPALRGSPGFGKSWLAAGIGPLREDAIKDIGAVLVWLRAQRDIDAQRVVVSGRGLGGTLALDALVNFSDRVRGGVAQGAISDVVEWLGTMGADSQARLRAGFGDDRDLQMRASLRRLSPLANIERIKRPMLIAHGRHDREVPLSQSEQLVSVARSRNLPVWYLVANDEAHEFGGKEASDAFFATFAQFLGTVP